LEACIIPDLTIQIKVHLCHQKAISDSTQTLEMQKKEAALLCKRQGNYLFPGVEQRGMWMVYCSIGSHISHFHTQTNLISINLYSCTLYSMKAYRGSGDVGPIMLTSVLYGHKC